MRAGKVAGIQLILNNWFLLLIVLFALVGMLGKVLAVFAAVMFHEMAHALAAYQFGYRVREIELLPFGGVARIERLGEAGAKIEALVAIVGPLASFVLAAGCQVGLMLWPQWTQELLFYRQVNLALALFNLLPALPLDGGRIFRAILTGIWGYQRATAAVVSLSKLISLGLVLAMIAQYSNNHSFNITFVMVAIFLYTAAKVELKAASFRAMRILANKKAELTARGVMPTTQFTAMASAAARDIVRLFGPDQYHVVLVVDEVFRVRGTLTETEVWEALPARGLYAKIGEFL